MKIGKNSPERLLKEMIKLDPVQFLGVCKIIGVDIYKKKDIEAVEENDESAPAPDKELVAKEFDEIWSEVCDTVDSMNRTRRRNLAQLLYAATKKEK